MAQRQRKGTPEKGGGGNTAFYAVLGVIALVGVVAIGYAVLGGGGGGEAVTEPIDLDVADTRALYEQATPVRLGSNDAPIKIVEFADFQCPACQVFSLQGRPRLMPYIESGLAQLIYYDFPLGGSHVHSFLAARAARCAGEQPAPGGGDESAYWMYHDKLYQEQPNWSVERDAAESFIGYAEEVGLDRGAFAQCLRSERFADVVTANRLVGEQLGVRGTPTVLVNNRRMGGQYISDMVDNTVQVLEQAQAQAGQSGAPVDAPAEGGDTASATPAGAGATGSSGGR